MAPKGCTRPAVAAAAAASDAAAVDRDLLREYWMTLGLAERTCLLHLDKDAVVRAMREPDGRKSCLCKDCYRKQVELERAVEDCFDEHNARLQRLLSERPTRQLPFDDASAVCARGDEETENHGAEAKGACCSTCEAYQLFLKIAARVLQQRVIDAYRVRQAQLAVEARRRMAEENMRLLLAQEEAEEQGRRQKDLKKARKSEQTKKTKRQPTSQAVDEEPLDRDEGAEDEDEDAMIARLVTFKQPTTPTPVPNAAAPPPTRSAPASKAPPRSAPASKAPPRPAPASKASPPPPHEPVHARKEKRKSPRANVVPTSVPPPQAKAPLRPPALNPWVKQPIEPVATAPASCDSFWDCVAATTRAVLCEDEYKDCVTPLGASSPPHGAGCHCPLPLCLSTSVFTPCHYDQGLWPFSPAVPHQIPVIQL